MARALIGPTGYGSYGIVWRDFPAMEGRGGYSGPFSTKKETIDAARDIAGSYGMERIDVEFVENVNKRED